MNSRRLMLTMGFLHPTLPPAGHDTSSRTL
jgi:hypothetical protein